MYKVLKIEAFADKESLLGDQHKYRTVFEAQELGFLYIELVVHNSYFEEQDWSCEVRFVGYWRLLDGEEDKIFELTESYSIGKEVSRAHLATNWGAPEKGGYWIRGVYRVEAYLDEEFCGDVYIVVEKEHFKAKEINPYFELLDLKMFPIFEELLPAEQWLYSKQFIAKETAFIGFAFTIRNKLDYIWRCELVLNVYNEQGEQLFTKRVLGIVEPTEEEIILVLSYGREGYNYWQVGNYTIKVLFMEKIIATDSFEVV